MKTTEAPHAMPKSPWSGTEFINGHYFPIAGAGKWAIANYKTVKFKQCQLFVQALDVFTKFSEFW